MKLALNSLQRQTKTGYELIVVDNNSTDHTRELVLNFIIENVDINYFFETNVGLSYARNRGVVEAKGEYLAYIDDDCILPENWVASVYEIIESSKSKIFGGPVFPFYVEQKPKWFKDDYQTFSFGNEPIFLSKTNTVFGGNMVIANEVFAKIGDFNTSLGMIGQKVMYSEETDFQLRYLSETNDTKIFYEPKLFVFHYVRPEKFELFWNIKSFMGKGKSNYHAKAQKFNLNKSKVFISLIIQSLKLIYFFSIGSFLRNRGRYPFYQNYIIERVKPHLKKYGFLIAQFQN
ncbi:glycosyltransferase [Belliella sp. R4-6]|uniref:Glycosyltransferase n=1 Tax=Belliella alkalica TaxID=1730871 RepID=A0ABS9V836_9BACT|nr:glycosyltransferase [Belliella alkalica]